MYFLSQGLLNSPDIVCQVMQVARAKPVWEEGSWGPKELRRIPRQASALPVPKRYVNQWPIAFTQMPKGNLFVCVPARSRLDFSWENHGPKLLKWSKTGD